jgi:hypothetical protein
MRWLTIAPILLATQAVAAAPPSVPDRCDIDVVALRRELYANGGLIGQREWKSTVPRDGQ